MSDLYGRMRGYGLNGEPMQRSEVTAQGSREMTTQLETWDGVVKVELDRKGVFRVLLGPKGSEPTEVVMVGNVNERTARPARLGVGEDGSSEEQ